MSSNFSVMTSSADFNIEVWGKLMAKAIVDPSDPFDTIITFSYSLSI